MNLADMKFDISNLVQTAVASVVAIVGATLYVTTAHNNASQAEAQVSKIETQQREDHDKLVTHDRQLTDIAGDVSEIKQDVKKLLQRGQ